MAITTDNEKLAMLDFGQVFMPALPILPGVLDQADQQQLLHGFPGVLWGGTVAQPVPADFPASRTRIGNAVFRRPGARVGH